MQSLNSQTQSGQTTWPSVYRNRETAKVYAPHHRAEYEWIIDDTPRYALAKGGEGGGKSVAGIIKSLERLRRGMSGIMASPDLPHFKKSLWQEFRRWCPDEIIIERQRYRMRSDWEPHESFMLSFVNGTALYCGGMEDPMSWEGPNVNFAHLDEARRAPSASALKVLDGRIRIAGPHDEAPQLWLTTTPRMNWLHEYFGPLLEGDTRKSFKENARVISLYTKDNASNLAPGYVDMRRNSLTEAEARVLLEAAWEDIDTLERFLPDMTLWDTCIETLPALTRQEPMVIALDAGTKDDNFGMVGITRHPARHTDLAVRFSQCWKPVNGIIHFQGSEDNPGPERVLRRLCKEWNVVCVTYDPSQLHDMATRLSGEGVAWFREFNQSSTRLESDKQLFDLIVAHRISHDGTHAGLRAHIDNANKKPDPETRKTRIVKREQSMKIDLAVCLSMASYASLVLDI